MVTAPLLPAAISNTWASAPHLAFHWTWMLPLLPAGAVWRLEARGRRLAAVAVIAGGAVAGMVFLKITAEPAIDRMATARDLGRQVLVHAQAVCLEGVRREWQYGLNYYAGTSLPDCRTGAKPFRVIEKAGFAPILTGPRTSTDANKTVDPR